MALPFNPMSFVTPYTAVGTSRIGSGAAMANAANAARNTKVQEGYLANTQKRTDLEEQHYGEQAMDQARAQLEAALEFGNPDRTEAALNNLRVIAQRYGYPVTEVRGTAQLDNGVADAMSETRAVTGASGSGTEEDPFDVDSPEFQAEAEAETKPSGSATYSEEDIANHLRSVGGLKALSTGPASADPNEAGANARIDAQLAPSPFTGQVPGGSLPSPFGGNIPLSALKPVPMPDRPMTADPSLPRAIPMPEAFSVDPSLPRAVPMPVIEPGGSGALKKFGIGGGGSGSRPEAAPRVPGGSLPIAPPQPSTGQPALQGFSILGKDGKPLYTVAPKDIENRQRSRATGVFQGLREKTRDPNEQQWLDEAEAIAGRLVGVVSLDEAVKAGLAHFTNRVNGANKMAVVEANRKPRYGGGGGAPSTGGYATGREGQAQRALTDDAWAAVNNTMANFDIKGLNKTDNGLANAQAGLTSSNPASQRGAIRNILKAMSGLTVNAKEEAGYAQLAGLAEQARNMLAQLTGDDMSPEYIAAVKQMLSEWRAESAKIRGEAGRKAADAYLSFAPQAPDDVLQGQADGIYRYFVGGDGGGGAPKYKPPGERAKAQSNTPGKKLLED